MPVRGKTSERGGSKLSIPPPTSAPTDFGLCVRSEEEETCSWLENQTRGDIICRYGIRVYYENQYIFAHATAERDAFAVPNIIKLRRLASRLAVYHFILPQMLTESSASTDHLLKHFFFVQLFITPSFPRPSLAEPAPSRSAYDQSQPFPSNPFAWPRICPQLCSSPDS